MWTRCFCDVTGPTFKESISTDKLGFVTDVVVGCQLLHRGNPGFSLADNHMGLVVDKVELVQLRLRLLRVCSCQLSFEQCPVFLLIHIIPML